MNSKFKKYFLISIAVHVVFFLSLFLSLVLKQRQQKANPVEVTLMNPDEIKALLKKTEKEPSQIVETDSATANLQKNDEAKLFSEKNNTTERQTIAKLGQTFKNSKVQGSKAIPPQQTEKLKQVAAKPKSPDIFNQTFDPNAAFAKNKMKQELQNLSTGQGTANMGETSTTNDRVEDVSSDLITLLNTKEYKYYGFYHRIKIQLNQWWQPKVREKVAKMVRQGRTIASDSSKETRLMIVLNEKGTIIKIQVLNASGVRDLDDAAVEAFKAAAPFPNPPKGIMDRDGTVKIPWNFVIES